MLREMKIIQVQWLYTHSLAGGFGFGIGMISDKEVCHSRGDDGDYSTMVHLIWWGSVGILHV